MADHDPAVERAAERLGALAAMQGKPYEANPYSMRPELHLAWSQGHNSQRASMLLDQSK